MDKTMNDIRTFTNIEFGEIRCIKDAGVVLFAGIDIAKALGYKNPAATLNHKIPDNEKTKYTTRIVGDFDRAYAPSLSKKQQYIALFSRANFLMLESFRIGYLKMFSRP